jgi:hypothetical protein
LAHPTGEPDRLVALKVYKPQLPFDTALRGKLASPHFRRHVPELYGFGVEQVAGGISVGWEAMEYFPLGSLADHVHRLSPNRHTLTPAQLYPIVSAVIDALSFWENVVSQRQTDLSPGNILVRRETPDLELVLGDLGGVRGTGGSQTFVGKPIYLAPEATLAGVNHTKGPYWSLGVICYQLLTGGLVADLDERTRRMLVEGDPDLTAIPEGRWRDLVAGLLTRQPGDRWGDPEVRHWLATSHIPAAIGRARVAQPALPGPANPPPTLAITGPPPLGPGFGMAGPPTGPGNALVPAPFAPPPAIAGDPEHRALAGSRDSLVFDGRPYSDPIDLAMGMVGASDEAARWLAGPGAPRLHAWLTEHAPGTRFELGLLTTLRGNVTAAHVVVAAFAATYLPSLQPLYRGEVISAHGLSTMALDPPQHEKLRDIVDSGVLAYASRHTCGHTACRGGCQVLDQAGKRSFSIAEAARVELTGIAVNPRTRASRKAAPLITAAVTSPLPRPVENAVYALSVLAITEPRRLSRLRRPLRTHPRPFAAWWRRRRAAALKADLTDPTGAAAIVVAVVLLPYVRDYLRALAGTPRSQIAGGLPETTPATPSGPGTLRRSWASTFGLWLTTQAGRAGASLTPWLLTIAASLVTALGVTPAVTRFLHSDPSTGSALTDAGGYLHDLPASVTGGVDPLRQWTSGLAPPGAPWMVDVAVPVVLLICLTIARRLRRTRAGLPVRIGAALIGRLVMAAVLLDLVLTGAQPLIRAATSLPPLELAGVVVGGAILTRAVTGGGPFVERSPGLAGLTRRLATLAALVATLVGLQALPAGQARPTLAFDGTVGADQAALLAGPYAVYATGGPDAVNVTATLRDRATKVWTQQLPMSSGPLRLSATGAVLTVHSGAEDSGPIDALRLSDGTLLWHRDAGAVYAFNHAVLAIDPHAGKLLSLDENSGGTRWSVPFGDGYTVGWSLAPTDVFRPGPADGATRTLGSFFTIDPSGTVRSYTAADPTHVVTHSGIARGALDVVQIGDQLLVTTTMPASTANPAGTATSYEVTAYAASTVTRALWTWTAPAGAGRPSAPQPCGTALVCVADSAMTRIISTQTGILAGAVVGDTTLAYGLADRYVVALTADGGAVVASPDGTVRARFADTLAYPLSGTSLLLLSGTETGQPTVTVFDVDPGRSYQLGRVPANPSACDWDGSELVCAAATLQEWELTH